MSVPCGVCGKPAVMGGGDFDTMVCSMDCVIEMSIPRTPDKKRDWWPLYWILMVPVGITAFYLGWVSG